MKALLVVLASASVLVACASGNPQSPEIATLDVPAILTTCPRGVAAPPAPPTPRTVEQVVDWARAVSAAQDRTEKARAECAYRLRKLNSWIAANQVVPGNLSLPD